jgi:hypothetical protein
MEATAITAAASSSQRYFPHSQDSSLGWPYVHFDPVEGLGQIRGIEVVVNQHIQAWFPMIKGES